MKRRRILSCWAFAMAYAAFAHTFAEEIGSDVNLLGMFLNVATGTIIAVVATRGAK